MSKNDDSGYSILLLIGLIVGAIYLLYLLVIFSAKVFVYIGFNSLFYLDNILHAPFINPIIIWGILGLLAGSTIGAFIGIRKYKLVSTLILYPLGVLFLFLLIMGLINKPLSDRNQDLKSTTTSSSSSIAQESIQVQNRSSLTEPRDQVHSNSAYQSLITKSSTPSIGIGQKLIGKWSKTEIGSGNHIAGCPGDTLNIFVKNGHTFCYDSIGNAKLLTICNNGTSYFFGDPKYNGAGTGFSIYYVLYDDKLLTDNYVYSRVALPFQNTSSYSESKPTQVSTENSEVNANQRGPLDGKWVLTSSNYGYDGGQIGLTILFENGVGTVVGVPSHNPHYRIGQIKWKNFIPGLTTTIQNYLPLTNDYANEELTFKDPETINLYGDIYKRRND